MARTAAGLGPGAADTAMDVGAGTAGATGAPLAAGVAGPAALAAWIREEREAKLAATARAAKDWAEKEQVSAELVAATERAAPRAAVEQAANELDLVDLLAAEGKLKENAAHTVAGAVAIRYRSNKHAANEDQPGREHERPYTEYDGKRAEKNQKLPDRRNQNQVRQDGVETA